MLDYASSDRSVERNFAVASAIDALINYQDADEADIVRQCWFRENDSLANQAERLAGFSVGDGEKVLRLIQAARMEFAQ